ALLAGTGVMLALRARRSARLAPALIALALIGAGGFSFVPHGIALWLTAGAGVVLAAMLIGVILSGHWWTPAGYSLGVVFLFSLGGVALPAVTLALNDAATFLITLRPLAPWWLVLLVLLPASVWLGFRSMAGLGPVRRGLALGLRCLLLLLLILALADTHAIKSSDRITVLFVWDRPLAIPRELARGLDGREGRVTTLITDAVTHRGPGREKDRAGLIVFGRTARLELPPESVPQLPIKTIHSPIDGTYTDVSAAIKLALASFPEDT